MKKLLLSMIVLASLVSCGKDNKVSSTNSTLNYSNPYLSGNTQAQTYAQTLIAQINSYSSNFGNGVISSGSSNQTCDTKWGIFYYCYTSSSGSSGTTTTWNSIVASTPTITYQYSNGVTVRHSDVNIASKQSELISILNAATNVQVQAMSGGNVYYITVSGAYYVIDTRYPIQANPSGVQSSSGTRYFVRAI
ncbi:hypothetical protein DOM21_02540 [Bacteriovorax stolpii]|uniref:Uncharacterized protein n=1 Tax=Bacteriovorax stolpii TaxID=960 RepID=A0A2K9NY30_BACTC|nr:hypothetical protein [Bacteriovorax stolpii]AUN99654.1 hypothetical protein C0V70_16375 [Bacteriovorax stolpii]QDK40349.1 hypothetical protein DOM21_02540 [Bacteriovorax stolpii]TDP51285.1 hypothetical protein C8D79_3457 [Bacteriovorax stolpii]